MKRLLLILAFLLPVQFTSVALGAYCQHEQDEAAQHFGHHAHAHKASDASDGESPLQPHNDCAACHAHALGLVRLPEVLPEAVLSASGPPLHLEPLSLGVFDEPERPKWGTAV